MVTVLVVRSAIYYLSLSLRVSSPSGRKPQFVVGILVSDTELVAVHSKRQDITLERLHPRLVLGSLVRVPCPSLSFSIFDL